MSAPAGIGTERPHMRRFAARPPSFRLALAIIVVVQACWLGTLMSRGWYYQDDLAFLAQATGRSLGPGYLTDPINDHLSPGTRLVFWLIRPLGITDFYWTTTVARLAMQAATTLLLGRLLTQLAGPTRLVLGVLAAYALSPLLLGPLWLACAVNVMPAQLLALVGLLRWVHYVRRRRLADAAIAGACFGLAATFLELSAVTLLLLPPLTVGFLLQGSVRQRLLALASHWRGWLLVAAPVALFGVWFVAGGYGGSLRRPSAGGLLRAVWESWSQTVVPAALGGPWRWQSVDGVYFSATDMPTAGVILAQLALLIAVIVSLLRRGRRALVAWSIPVVASIAVSLLVALGRLSQFGLIFAHQLTYAWNLAVPLALGVTLAFASPVPAAGPSQLAPAPVESATAPRRARAGVAALLAVVVGGALLSGWTFTNRWQENPTRDFFATLRHELDDHPDVRMYDTTVPLDVVPFIEPRRRLSDFVPLLGGHVRLPTSAAPDTVVDAEGRLRPAVFLPAARARTRPAPFCSTLLRGRTTITRRLVGSAKANEWFVRLAYFQQTPSTVYVTMSGPGGHEVAPVSGTRTMLDGRLSTYVLRFPTIRPEAIHIRTDASATNLCLTDIDVGYPFPKATR